MKATNSLTAKAKKPTFSMVINSDSMKSMINKSLGDPRRAASFTSTLISTVSASEKLRACNPESIVSAALQGESMNLSLALGQYSIVPYGDSANYQLSYKGLSQLATRSGQYKDFGVFDVREGEYKGKDHKTRQPMIEWLEDDERENLPLAGFYGFYELKDGFFKSIYWTHEKILNHANRYSKAFDKEKYDAMQNGKMDEKEVTKLRNGSPWYDEALSEAHMKMCKKTILMQMLNDGTAPLSVEMQNAINYEKVTEQDGEIIFADDSRIVNAETGEVTETTSEDNIVDVEATVVE